MIIDIWWHWYWYMPGAQDNSRQKSNVRVCMRVEACVCVLSSTACTWAWVWMSVSTCVRAWLKSVIDYSIDYRLAYRLQTTVISDSSQVPSPLLHHVQVLPNKVWEVRGRKLSAWAKGNQHCRWTLPPQHRQVHLVLQILLEDRRGAEPCTWTRWWPVLPCPFTSALVFGWNLSIRVGWNHCIWVKP